MLFSPIYLVGFDQHVFLQFYYKTIMWSKIANFQVLSIKKITCIIRKLIKKDDIKHAMKRGEVTLMIMRTTPKRLMLLNLGQSSVN